MLRREQANSQWLCFVVKSQINNCAHARKHSIDSVYKLLQIQFVYHIMPAVSDKHVNIVWTCHCLCLSRIIAGPHSTTIRIAIPPGPTFATCES